MTDINEPSEPEQQQQAGEDTQPTPQQETRNLEDIDWAAERGENQGDQDEQPDETPQPTGAPQVPTGDEDGK